MTKRKKNIKFILTDYRIRNKKTGLFRSGGDADRYSDKGKTWSSNVALRAYLTGDKQRRYEHPQLGWLNWNEWYQTEGRFGKNAVNYPSRAETLKEMIARRFDSNDEVIEIMIDAQLNPTVNRYDIETFLVSVNWRLGF